MNPFGVNEDSNGSPVPAKATANPFSGSNSPSASPLAAPTPVQAAPPALQETPTEPAQPLAPEPVSKTTAPPASTQSVPEPEPCPDEEHSAINGSAPLPSAIEASSCPANAESVNPSLAPQTPAPTVDAPTAPAPEQPAEPPPQVPTVAPATPPVLGTETPPEPEPPATSPHPFAWQPFTFSGIAAFAHASVNRLLLVQVIISLIVGGTVLWFVDRNHAPVLVSAIKKMPEEAAIRRGILFGAPSQLLAENKFLSFAIDLQQVSPPGQTADLQLELHRYEIQVSSIFSSAAGVLRIPYPSIAFVPMSDAALEPWWGAWQPIVYVAIVLAVSIFLMITWTLLATLYALISRLVAYYADRTLRSDQGWNVAGAALMPGALIMEAGILLYGFEILDLIGLGMFTAVHFVVGWIYAMGAPFSLPRREDCPPPNPFNN